MSDDEIRKQKMEVLYEQHEARERFRVLAVALQLAGEKIVKIGNILDHADCTPQYSQVATLLGSETIKGIAFLNSDKLTGMLRDYEEARENLINRNKQVQLLKLD